MILRISVLLLFLAACATSPTGRKQLQLIGDGQMSAMGIQSFDQMKQQVPIEKDLGWNAYVRCVALPITQVVSGKSGDWEIVVFKDDSANAFALPGGKIGVHTGILKVAVTDSQLAAVLGHEVGHVLAKHGNERMSDALATQGLVTAVGVFASSKDPQKQSLMMAALGMGAQVGVLLPFSRAQESEADIIGLDLMSRAGFDPRQSIELWRNMMKASGGKQPPALLSTHPSNQARIDQLSQHMSESIPKYDSARAAGRAPVCRRPE